MTELRSEFLVIGSGPGGAVAACELAHAGRDVLILEQGRKISPDPHCAFGLVDMATKYRNGGLTAAIGKPKIAYVEGMVVGGGSEVNSGLYHRTPASVLEKWRQEYDVVDLSDNSMRSFHEEIESTLNVSKLPIPAPGASLKLAEGARALGWKCEEIPRWFSFGPEDFTNAKLRSFGKRNSMSATFLARAVSRGARLVTGRRAIRLRRSRGDWETTVVDEATGLTSKLRSKYVVSSGGAIQTPGLLQKSGFRGPVGKSLRMHPMVKVVAEFPEEVNDEFTGVPVHQVLEFSPEQVLGCSISSLPFIALGLQDYRDRVPLPDLSTCWKRMAVYYTAISDSSLGKVVATPMSHDPLVLYSLSNHGFGLIEDGLKKLIRLLFEAGADALYPSVSKGSPLERGRFDSGAIHLTRANTQLMTIHLFSSCPMGENRKLCAVDSYGRVHGAKNLFISDASILCTAPGVNPQGTILALALRNSRAWLNEGKT